MFEDLVGRFVGGAIWGLGAGVVLAVTRGNNSGLRPAAKSVMKAYLVASDRVRTVTAEAREHVEDIYAEAKAERQDEESGSTAAADGATPAAAANEGPTSGADVTTDDTANKSEHAGRRSRVRAADQA